MQWQAGSGFTALLCASAAACVSLRAAHLLPAHDAPPRLWRGSVYRGCEQYEREAVAEALERYQRNDALIRELWEVKPGAEGEEEEGPLQLLLKGE